MSSSRIRLPVAPGAIFHLMWEHAERLVRVENVIHKAVHSPHVLSATHLRSPLLPDDLILELADMTPGEMATCLRPAPMYVRPDQATTCGECGTWHPDCSCISELTAAIQQWTGVDHERAVELATGLMRATEDART